MSLGNQFGLLPTGLVIKGIEDVTDDLETGIQAQFGASVNVTPQSRFGQIIGIMAERYSELWNLLEAVHGAFNPDDATGQDLVNVAAISGTVPLVPTPSTALVACTGTAAAVLSSGRTLTVTGTGSQFISTADATLALAASWAHGTTYTIGQQVTNSGVVLQCAIGGLSAAGGGGPSGAQGATVVDNGVTWVVLGSGTYVANVPFASAANGPIVAVAGSLVTITSPVTNWSSAYNVSDATLGQLVETDGAFRIRREAELHGAGRAAVESIKAALLKVPLVTACTVFENVTDTTNGDGMPPHSVEVLVQGGDPAAICTAIFQNIAAGIATTGNQSPVTVTDSQGITHSILYSRPTIIPIYVIVNALVWDQKFPSNGTAQIIANLVAYGLDVLVADYDIFASQLGAAILNGVPSSGVSGISGVLDPGLPLIGTAPSPGSSTTISITSRQLGQISSGHVTVNLTHGVP